MSLSLTIASVAVIAAGVALTVNQFKVNRVMADKSKMMQETAELVQKLAEEPVNPDKVRQEKRASQSVDVEQMLADIMRQCEEDRVRRHQEQFPGLDPAPFDIKSYTRNRAEFWGS